MQVLPAAWKKSGKMAKSAAELKKNLTKKRAKKSAPNILLAHNLSLNIH